MVDRDTGGIVRGAGGVTTRVLGCKVNYADVQSLRKRLPEAPAECVELVGTCCVTAEGEKQSRKEVRRALRRVGPEGVVYVSGCSVKLDPGPYTEMGENIVILDSIAAGSVGMATDGRTRSYLKIQDGCASMCSYCVIPQVRGRPRSIGADEVLAAAGAMLAAGYPELVVSGINVGGYRDGETGLAALLRKLLSLAGLKRLRLSSLEIMHLDDALLEIIAGDIRFGRHLHLPLQSGDDNVLAAMGRRYEVAEFEDRIARAREAVPGLNITTDAIAGFPVEGETAFANTMACVERLGFSRIHVFKYSPRPGTSAAALGDPVCAAEKKHRSRLLRELSDRLGAAHVERKRGQASEVLLESPLEQGLHTGYSSDYTRFIVRGGNSGEIVNVRAERVNGDAVWGKVVTDG